jgi:hypothetical protein
MASKTTEFLHKSRFALPKRRIESRHLKLLVLARFFTGLNGALAQTLLGQARAPESASGTKRTKLDG